MRKLASCALAALLVVSGCSKDKDVEPPAQLVKFPATLPVKKLWGDNVGGGKKQVKLRLGLGPAVDNGLVFAASDQGELVAVNLDSGHQVWLKKFKKVQFSAGPGAAAGMVVVGSTKGWVIALAGASGKELWRTHVNAELLSAPAISEKAVVMRSVDGRLHGFDSVSGKELWSVEQQVPRLSLRGTAIPVIAKEIAVSGFDNGKVMAVSLTTGDTVWDTALASPHGRTELDRLVDVDSAVSVVGENVFASGFQGRTAMLALDSGQIWWAHDMSSYRGLAVDGGKPVRHSVRRRRSGAAPARWVGAVAQRQAQAPRIERARCHKHGHRHRRLPGIPALAGQGDGRARRAPACRQISCRHAAGGGAGHRGRAYRLREPRRFPRVA